MTDEIDNMSDENEVPQESELDALKMRADQMGLKYHPSIGLDKLREKVNAELTGETDTEQTEGEGDTPSASEEATKEGDTETGEVEETDSERRRRKRQEANKLVRVRVTCMDPNKKDWEGDIFTVSNNLVGTVRKYVPFDVEWHVPQIVLNVMRAKQCQTFYTVKDNRGNTSRKGKLIKAFGIEVLPDLTEEEIAKLAQRQQMAQGDVPA